MEAYKPYVDFIMAGNVAQTGYILSKEGAICATSLPIQQMPQYQFEIEDENNPDVKHKIVMDERVNLLDALAHKGVSSQPGRIRLYNQKYFPVHYDEDTKVLYLKKEKGGACICQTKNFFIIGTFNTEQMMDNKVPQNPGELNKRVEALAKDLISKGH